MKTTSEYETMFEAVRGLAGEMRGLQRLAAQQCRPVVDDIVQSGSRDVEFIEHTLDGLLDFCGYEPVLAIFKKLCRHYWDIDPAATAYYINAYRKYWDNDKPETEPS